MKILVFVCLAISFLASSALYQSDDRKLLTSVSSSKIQGLGKRVALLTFSNDAQTQAHGFGRFYSFLGKSFLTGQNLKKTIAQSMGAPACPEIKFGNAFRAGNCSAFLLDHQTVITAGHCLSQFVASRLNLPKKFRIKSSLKSDAYPFLKDIKLVFNHKGKQGSLLGYYKIDNNSVYSVKEITKLTDGIYKDDYAVLKLDRSFHEMVPPIRVKKNSMKIKSFELATIGHPLGLPLIFTDNGYLRDQYIYQFTSTLDTFEGSSGSAVFDKRSGEILGLVSIGTGPSFEKRKSENCVDYKSYGQVSQYSSSMVYAHRLFSEAKAEEIFMQVLSNGNIKGDVRDLTFSAQDFSRQLSYLKSREVSYFYEAILAYINFSTTASIDYLLEEGFVVDQTACSKAYELSHRSSYFKNFIKLNCGTFF